MVSAPKSICKLTAIAIEMAQKSDMQMQLGAVIMSNSRLTSNFNRIQRPANLGVNYFVGHTTHAEMMTMRRFLQNRRLQRYGERQRFEKWN